MSRSRATAAANARASKRRPKSRPRTRASLPAPTIAPQAQPSAPDSVVGPLVDLGWDLFGQGAFDDAASICESALTMAPRHGPALWLRGMILRMRDRRVDAVEALTSSVAADPGNSRPFVELAYTHVELGDIGAAIEWCRRGLAVHPGDAELVALFGALLRGAGRVEASLAVLGEAARRPGSTPRVHGELAMALMAAHRPDEAAAAYRRAYEVRGFDVARRHIGGYRILTTEAWIASHRGRYEVLFEAREGCAFRPHYGDAPEQCEPVPMTLPPAYVAEVDDVTIVGGHDFVLTGDGTALYDVATRPILERVDLVLPAIPFIDGTSLLVDARRGETIECGALLAGATTTNYFHWLIEYLPRLLLLELAGTPLDVPLLVDAGALAIPQLADALAAVNSDGRPLIPLLPDVTYEVRRLVVPSAVSSLAANLRDRLPLELGDSVLAAEAIDYLRARLAPPGGAPDRRSRLYISRRPRTTRERLMNEAEVRNVFASAGFEIVVPETMSFGEQRDLFAGASVVASESGAGLTNLLFAPASCRLVCIQAEAWPTNPYADLTGHLRQPAVFVTGEPTANRPLKPYHVPFRMDVDRLRAVLARLDGPPEAAGRRDALEQSGPRG